MDKISEIKDLQIKIKKFVTERDWMQFHNHKDMAISLVLEANEVLEHFQWKNPEEVKKRAETHKDQLEEEIADVAIYLLELAENLNIDLSKAVLKKIKKNLIKYPVGKAKGKHTKYNEY